MMTTNPFRKRDTPHILLVNPWIHDFAAYDFWAKPLGLLTLASILRRHGFNITYLDCMDRFHAKAPQTDPYARHGRGPYLKTKIPKPGGLEDIPRNFSRYGIKEKWFREDLLCIQKPDLVLMTSMMTYWHTGVTETIGVIKDIFPDVTIVLGGIYASLCHEHALNCSGAHRIQTGPGEKHILKLVGEHTGFSVTPTFDPDDLDTYPYPTFELQRKITYIPLQTSKGCPFACQYCASHFLNPKRMVRNPESVVEEIKCWHEKYNVKDFVFYDDALLVDAEKHAAPMLEGIINAGLKVRFHTPNAVHIREISKQTARLMFHAGFKTLRLGLETTSLDIRNELDKKVTVSEFVRAVTCLKKAGFDKNMIGVYLMAGLPGQQIESIENSIQTVRRTGATPILAYYSPIPKTALWGQAVASSRYNLESDPIFTNNAILPCRNEPFSWQTISHLKNLAA
ncbi:MAG: B12-binding domain-containing radical SAM protein, partial [Desulfobacterales bacterium S5133MH16]